MVRSVRLTANPTGSAMYGALRERTKIAEPAQQMYGIYGPQYAAALTAQATNNEANQSQAERAFANAALRNNSNREAREYAEMLARAQDLQMLASQNDNRSDYVKEILSQDPEMAKVGGLGMRTVGVDEKGNPVINYDPTQTAVVNADALNTNQADRFKTKSDAYGVLSEHGYNVDPSYIGQDLAPPTQETPVPITHTTDPLTPKDQTDRYGQDQGLTYEQQLALAAAKGSGSEDDDYADYELQYDASGRPIGVKYKGKPEQIARTQEKLRSMGINPATGEQSSGGAPPLNPNADGNGGVPSATPAAPKVKTTLKVATQPAEGFFAAKYMTSDKGPRKRPIAGASTNHKGQDFGHPAGSDVPAEHNGQVLFAGPMKGFGRAAKIRYEDGSVVLYGHINPSVKIGDTVKKGQKFASVLGKGQGGISTGPHVHRQIVSEGNPEKAYATRLKQHPLVADVKVVDGKSVVTMKDGTSRVYQKGHRIG